MTSRLREGLLWAGAVAGLLSLVAAVAVTFFGFSFLIFRSGSMGPDIPTGSLALARTTGAADIRSGDVVSVIAANGERLTHRVQTTTVRIVEDGSIASLVLQGDANASPDAEIYEVAEAEREIASVPYAGYAVSVLLSPPGLVAGGCLAAMLLLVGFGGGSSTRPTGRGGLHRAEKDQPRTRAGAALMVAAVVVAGAGVTSTSAAFTDQGTLVSGQFTSRSLPAPTLTCGQGTGASVDISFPTANLPPGVTFIASLDNGVSPTVPASGNTRSFNINQGQAPAPALTLANFLVGASRDYTVTVTARLGNWSAVTTTEIRSSREGLIAGTTGIRCL